jgi:hypothetical protein
MMWYKIKRICIKKVKKFCIVVNFFIWIVIKNYWCDIKNEKSMNVLMFGGWKYKKVIKKLHKQ